MRGAATAPATAPAMAPATDPATAPATAPAKAAAMSDDSSRGVWTRDVDFFYCFRCDVRVCHISR